MRTAWFPLVLVVGLGAMAGCGWKRDLAQGNNAAERDDWVAAAHHYQAAAAAHPDDPALEKRLSEAQDKAIATLLGQARKARESGDLDQAVNLVEQAEDLHPRQLEVEEPGAFPRDDYVFGVCVSVGQPEPQGVGGGDLLPCTLQNPGPLSEGRELVVLKSRAGPGLVDSDPRKGIYPRQRLWKRRASSSMQGAEEHSESSGAEHLVDRLQPFPQRHGPAGMQKGLQRQRGQASRWCAPLLVEPGGFDLAAGALLLLGRLNPRHHLCAW